jgi:hypothetical protein
MIRFLLLFLLCGRLDAFDRTPWLPPLWEFQSQGALAVERQSQLQTEQGEVSLPGTLLFLRPDLALTVWPNWEAEVTLSFVRTPKPSFLYEATFCQLRYQWMNDLEGDPLALVAGLFVALPNSTLLHSRRFLYHGEFNAEAYASFGKEWSWRNDWACHVWALAALGMANRGYPWVHLLAHTDWKPNKQFIVELFGEWLSAFGPHSLNLNKPFHGYANIHHRTLTIGCQIEREDPLSFNLALKGWYNLYARNFFIHFWGIELLLSRSFSL